MKKRLVVWLSVALAAGMLAGCGKGGSSRKKLTVGFDAEFPPYGYMGDDGEYTGFDLEFAQAVCDKEGWELFTMNGREDLYTWTEPYIDNSQVFVVPTDSGIKSQADLAGKKVGVQKDSSALAALEGDSKDLADTFGNLTQYADYNTAFMDLTAGAIDAVAIDIGVANYEIGQRGSGYKILDDYLSTEQYAVGFKLGNTELRDIVQKDMDALAKDGTVDKIAAEYADFGIPESLCIGKDQ